MFRLLRGLVILGALGAFIWFGLTVELGDKTLFGHLRNISNTNESRELLRGTKEKVGDLVGRATDRVAKGMAKGMTGQVRPKGEGSGEEEGVAPMEQIADKDREALKGIIGRGSEKP